MPIAKIDLFDGFTLVAAKGTYISNSSVEAHGWQEQVEAGEDPTNTEPERAKPARPQTPPAPGQPAA